MYIGYFDESKKNITIDDQKSIVMSYINKHQMNVDIFFSSADFSSIIAQINSENHTIIVANIACLGNKLEKIKDNLENLMSSKLDLISITEEMHLKSDDTLSEAIDGINLAIKIRSSMVSTITKKALNKKREQGYKLGRDFGYKHKRYIWEGKEEEIIKKLKSGLSRLKTAKEVGISVVSLYNFLKLYPELKRGAK
ncbi:MAG: hypothetical protein IKC10_03390 [Alphaproteobacteria bacterium]|nr:hypothetical protein [Alphaproteobacteria bacterium]